MNIQYNKWVSMWGNAMSITDHKPQTYARDLSLRYPVYCPFNGSKIRITLDNYCGTEDITITRASVLYKDKFYPLYFNSSESVTIPEGASSVSDELEINITAYDTLAVTIYLGDFTLMRSSVVALGPLSSGTYAVGDFTNVIDIPNKLSRKTDVFFFLSNISILTEEKNRCIVCYGDSITAQDWPDYLNIMCRENGKNDTVFIRRATSGSRILREYDNITYESYGLKGTNRFEHEVPTDGCDTVIIQQGINDIIHPVGVEVNPFRPMSDLPTVNEMIEGIKWYILKGREYGYKVILGTLLPIEGWRTYADFREVMKNEFNDWLRTTTLADGCVDFDKALRNAQNEKAFLPEFDSGDHLHPSKAGYKKMAEEVFNTIFE